MAADLQVFLDRAKERLAEARKDLAALKEANETQPRIRAAEQEIAYCKKRVEQIKKEMEQPGS
jgi:chromosome segregation ATPase